MPIHLPRAADGVRSRRGSKGGTWPVGSLPSLGLGSACVIRAHACHRAKHPDSVLAAAWTSAGGVELVRTPSEEVLTPTQVLQDMREGLLTPHSLHMRLKRHIEEHDADAALAYVTQSGRSDAAQREGTPARCRRPLAPARLPP